MVSLSLSRVVSSLLCAAALGGSAFGCGSSVEVEGASSPPIESSDAGPDAPPPDDPPDPSDPLPDAGSVDPPGSACDCPSSPGFVLSGDLGPLTLTAPFILNSDLIFCMPPLAYAWGFHCSWNETVVVLNACVEKNVAPCIRITWMKPDHEGAVATLNGTVIDAAGEMWILNDIALSGDLPWDGPAAVGTFTAVGTNEKGNQSIAIEGSFDLCVAESSACTN